ncbi:MAG: hypothetical protein LBM39_03160 [Candidatus Methanoplasma sp.]|nr:hypothetical protein [Candidatus Methanoplasma sp.]
MHRKKYDSMMVLAVILCVIVLFGEYAAYSGSFYDYDAHAELKDGTIDYSVSSSGSDTYTAIALDNTSSSPTVLYIYIDDTYDTYFDIARDETGIVRNDLDYSSDQLKRSMAVRGFDNVVLCGPDELLGKMLEDVGTEFSKGLLVMSYALPEKIYSGSADNLIFEWLSGGGTLYWAGTQIGAYYTGNDGLTAVDNGQELFLGTKCVNTDGPNIAYSKIDAEGLTDALSINWNRVDYGLEMDKLPGATFAGYSENGYASLSFLPFGKGTVVVIGGEYNRHQCDDISQLVAAGITAFTSMAGVEEGSVTRTTVEGRIQPPEGSSDVSLYVYIGGDYTVFGKVFHDL